METILSQINSVPGMIGSMVCDDQGHLLARVFPPSFDAKVLKEAVSVFTDNLPGLRGLTDDIVMFDFRCLNGRIIIRPVAKGYLILLCSSAVNLQFLTISMNVAVKKLEKLDGTLPGSPEQDAPHPVASAPAGTRSPEELLESGPLSSTLQAMRMSLAKVLGPMARIIFMECVEKWLAANLPSKATLPHLVTIIAKEIDDRDKSARYREMVAYLM